MKGGWLGRRKFDKRGASPCRSGCMGCCGAGVAVEVVVWGGACAVLGVDQVATSSALAVGGSVGHALSPFQTGDRDNILGGVAPGRKRGKPTAANFL